MLEFYPEIRIAHITAAMASGGLFLLRGLLVQSGRAGWALAPVPRYLSYTIDTALLTAALMLFTILPGAAFANGWLTAKLVLLPVYISLGWFALRSTAGRSRRLGYFVSALLAYACMFVIARTHSPLGPIRLLTGS